MSYGMNAEYSRFHQHLRNIADQMPEKLDLRTKNDEVSKQKLQKCNQMMSEFLANQGLTLYLRAKPHKIEGREVTGPAESSKKSVDMIVKELDIVKLLRNPEKMERLILVNGQESSLKFLKSGEPEVTEEAEIHLKLQTKDPSQSGQTVAQNLHAKALEANDLHVLNEAMTLVLQEIQTAVEAQPTVKPAANRQQQQTGAQKMQAQAPVAAEREEEFTPASQRKEYVPPVQKTDEEAKAQARNAQEQRSLRKAGEEKRERFKQEKARVQEQKDLRRDERRQENIKTERG